VGADSQQTWWKRLLRAPESGLVLVIAAMMVLLTVFSGSRQVRDFVRSETPVVESGGSLSLTVDGKPRTLAASEGWTIRNDGQSVERTRTTNKFLNLENLMQVLVFASFIAIMAVGITAVIIMSGIDLSIGSTYALAALLTAVVLRYPFQEGLPALTLGGRGALWWIAIVVGAGAFVMAPWMRRSGALKRLLAGDDPSKPAGPVARSLPTALMWVGLGLVLAAGWQAITRMHTTGLKVQAGQVAVSTLSTPGAILLALVGCCGIGALCGWINGSMIVGLKVHPFIITLGTMAAYRGITALPTQAQSVANFPAGFQDAMLSKLSDLGLGADVTFVPILVMLAVCAAGVFVLSRTVLGRRVYAIGGNEVAASYAGIPVDLVKITVYTLMGALAGLSAFVYLGYFGGAEPAAGTGYELKAIAAAVIGGASLSGGRGSALGAVLGAILVQLIDNGMVMLNIDQSYNQVVLGAAIIAAVVLDQLKTRLTPGAKR
jgi:ribose transport system permease protein